MESWDEGAGWPGMECPAGQPDGRSWYLNRQYDYPDG